MEERLASPLREKPMPLNCVFRKLYVMLTHPDFMASADFKSNFYPDHENTFFRLLFPYLPNGGDVLLR
jgi:hypothetical protein